MIQKIIVFYLSGFSMTDLFPKQNDNNDFEADFNLIQLFDLLYKIDLRVNGKKGNVIHRDNE